MIHETKQNLFLFLAWLNYVISYGFKFITLSNISLCLSVVSSLVYIYVTLSKHFKDKNQNGKTGINE